MAIRRIGCSSAELVGNFREISSRGTNRIHVTLGLVGAAGTVGAGQEMFL